MNNRSKSNSTELTRSLSHLFFERKTRSNQAFNYYIGRFHQQKCAIKTFHRQNDFNHEQNIIQKLEIMTQYQSSQNYFIANIGFIDKPLYYVIEEIAPLTLYEAISSNQMSHELAIKNKIMLDLTKGLKILHSLNIIHNNLTAFNIHISLEVTPEHTCADSSLTKIGDFTNAVILDKQHHYKSLHIPLRYASPESQAFLKFSKASDVYSLSLNLWSILENQLPFATEHDPDIILGLKKSGEPLAFSNKTPKKYQKILSKCWKAKGQKRPNASELTTSLFKLNLQQSKHNQTSEPNRKKI